MLDCLLCGMSTYRHAHTPVAEHLFSSPECGFYDVAHNCVLVVSVFSGNPSCSTSSPGDNLIDDLPPVANVAKHSPLCLAFVI